MTETRAELIDRGWGTGYAFMADMDIVARMRCKHNGCGDTLALETWRKGNRTKQFTRCESCGHRQPF